jgi:hypothetical protein
VFRIIINTIYFLHTSLLTCATSVSLFLTRVKPTVVYGSETRRMTEMDVKRLNTWERRILRRIGGPVCERGI